MPRLLRGSRGKIIKTKKERRHESTKESVKGRGREEE
jgi:hypothetical protein